MTTQSSLNKLVPHPDNLNQVIDQFSPEILGAFWITDEDLNRDLLGFGEFNYLFNGLVSQYLYGQKDIIDKLDAIKSQEKSNLFFTHNFNQKLFLVHIKMHHEIAGSLDEHIALIVENKRDERKKILLFNTTSKDIVGNLQKRYSHFEFIPFNLSQK